MSVQTLIINDSGDKQCQDGAENVDLLQYRAQDAGVDGGDGSSNDVGRRGCRGIERLHYRSHGELCCVGTVVVVVVPPHARVAQWGQWLEMRVAPIAHIGRMRKVVGGVKPKVLLLEEKVKTERKIHRRNASSGARRGRKSDLMR